MPGVSGAETHQEKGVDIEVREAMGNGIKGGLGVEWPTVTICTGLGCWNVGL